MPKNKPSSSGKAPGSVDSPVHMPVLFFGHGSPMNAIEENECVAGSLTMTSVRIG